jgi:hypothetical protein
VFCRSPGRSASVLVSLLSLLAGTTPGQAAERDRSHIFVRGPVVLEVTQAFHAAIRKLETPACQELFTDFTDSEGRTLLENLGAQTPIEYLTGLIIRDGEIPKGSGQCAVPGSAAFTSGGAAVFVCGRNFHAERPSRRSIALIHEMLHVLGLRENPPSSAEITRQVEERCGR